MAERSFQRGATFNFPLRRDVLAQIKDQNRSCWLQFLVTSTIFKEERYALRIEMATLVSAWGCVLSTGTVPGNLLQGMMLWDRKITVRHQKLFTTPTKQSQGSAEVSPPSKLPTVYPTSELQNPVVWLYNFILEEIRRCDFLNPSTFPQSNFQKKAYRFSNKLICALLNS